MLHFNAVVIPDATTYSVLKTNAGILHIVPDLTADCTFALPAPDEGLSYRFQYGGGAADGADWVFQSPSATNYFIGGVVWLTSGTPDIEGVYSDGNSNDFLRIITPEAGTWVEFHADGTNWYVNGHAVSQTTPAFADT